MKRDPIELAEALEHTYATWNNPPSDGLPEGAGVLLEAADALRDMGKAMAGARMQAFEEAEQIADSVAGTTPNAVREKIKMECLYRAYAGARATLKGGEQDG